MFPFSATVRVPVGPLDASSVASLLARMEAAFVRNGAQQVELTAVQLKARGGVVKSKLQRLYGTSGYIHSCEISVSIDATGEGFRFVLSPPWRSHALSALSFGVVVGLLMRLGWWSPVLALAVWLVVEGGNFFLAAMAFRPLARSMVEGVTH